MLLPHAFSFRIPVYVFHGSLLKFTNRLLTPLCSVNVTCWFLGFYVAHMKYLTTTTTTHPILLYHSWTDAGFWYLHLPLLQSLSSSIFQSCTNTLYIDRSHTLILFFSIILFEHRLNIRSQLVYMAIQLLHSLCKTISREKVIIIPMRHQYLFFLFRLCDSSRLGTLNK